MTELQPTVEIGRFLAAILRRWRAIAACVLIALIGAGVYVTLVPATYTASAQVNVEVISEQPFASQQPPSELIDAATEQALVKSSAVVDRTADEVGDGITAAQVRRGVVAELKPGTTAMRISYAGSDAATAVRVADEVAEQYLRYRGELAANRQEDSLASLVERRDVLQTQLREAGSGRTILLNELSQLVAKINSINTASTNGGTVLTHASDVAPSVSPRKSTTLLVAGVAGLLLGLVVAVGVDAWRRRVVDGSDVAAAGGGTLLAQLTARDVAGLGAKADTDALRSVWHRLRARSGGDVPVVLVVGASDGAPATAVAGALEDAAAAVDPEAQWGSRLPRAVPVPAEEGHAVALGLAGRASAVVIAAERGRTSVRELQRLSELLRSVGVEPAGTIVGRRLDTDAADHDLEVPIDDAGTDSDQDASR